MLGRETLFIIGAERIVFLGFHFHEQGMRLLQAALPARGGNVSVFGTAVNRSDSAIHEIEKQIRSMLERRGGTWDIQVKSQWDCRRLFDEFETTWAR